MVSDSPLRPKTGPSRSTPSISANCLTWLAAASRAPSLSRNANATSSPRPAHPCLKLRILKLIRTQTPRFPHFHRTGTAAVPDQKRSKRGVELHTTSLTYPTDSSYEAFYFVVFRMWGAGVIHESILSKAVASALGNLR